MVKFTGTSIPSFPDHVLENIDDDAYFKTWLDQVAHPAYDIKMRHALTKRRMVYMVDSSRHIVAPTVPSGTAAAPSVPLVPPVPRVRPVPSVPAPEVFACAKRL
jgi:hypothetical protein